MASVPRERSSHQQDHKRAAMEPVRDTCQIGGMSSDPISTWVGFLASPAAPKTAMTPVELDGYLTGVAVSPDLLPPNRWLAGLWGKDEPIFDSQEQLESVFSAVTAHHNAIAAALNRGFKLLEAQKPTGFRPKFLSDGDKQNHNTVRIWVRGFVKAMALAPQSWLSVIEDERLRLLLAPIFSFTDMRKLEPADDPDELLDEAATAISPAIIGLYKLAQIKNGSRWGRREKFRRNGPCSCGSGLKYKRCCGADHSAVQ